MTPPAYFGIFSRSESISLEGCQMIAASIQAQLNEDVTPIWGRKGTIAAYASEAEVPQHVWKVIVEDDIGQPGALGYHTDEFNQPVSYVAAQGGDLDAVCVTVSHEVIETLLDFSGNRLISILHPLNGPLNHRRVRVLCEGCDMPEAKTYTKLDRQVSDFITPQWFDDEKQDGVKYTFLGSIETPRTLAPGGYMSYIDTDGKWYQLTWWGAEPIVEGPFNFDTADESLRETVDKHVRIAKTA